MHLTKITVFLKFQKSNTQMISHQSNPLCCVFLGQLWGVLKKTSITLFQKGVSQSKMICVIRICKDSFRENILIIKREMFIAMEKGVFLN